MEKIIFSSPIRFCCVAFRFLKIQYLSSVNNEMRFLTPLKNFCVALIRCDKRLISNEFNSKEFFSSSANGRLDLSLLSSSLLR